MQKLKPDLVLLDLLLPGMRGDEICKQMKADAHLKHVPVILFTATAQDVAGVAREIGADDYILKPFDPEELMLKIKRCIEKEDR